MEIESNERVLRITAPNGDSLEYDKETNRVSLDGSVEYSTFNKLVKQLKRTKNKESFSVEYYED